MAHRVYNPTKPMALDWLRLNPTKSANDCGRFFNKGAIRGEINRVGSRIRRWQKSDRAQREAPIEPVSTAPSSPGLNLRCPRLDNGKKPGRPPRQGSGRRRHRRRDEGARRVTTALLKLRDAMEVVDDDKGCDPIETLDNLLELLGPEVDGVLRPLLAQAY